MAKNESGEKIPYPRRYPFIGNLPQIFGDNTNQDFYELAKHYGPIFEMKLPAIKFYIATNYELCHVILDDSHFEKKVSAHLGQLRQIAGDGLFTAHNDEPNWAIAHNILRNGFSLKQMYGYLPRMYEITQQMIGKWLTEGSEMIEITDDFTRLTLDTIALCGFNYRFNSFSSKNLHPFLDGLGWTLNEALRRMKMPSIQLALRSDTRWNATRSLMVETVDGIIQDRLDGRNTTDSTDFLSLMLEGVDPSSGSKMSQENIRYNLITFLVAGHETTSGMLAFATYHLMKHPQIQEKARQEVDRVFGTNGNECPEWKQVGELQYIQQILKETLRLTPSVASIGRSPKEDILLGGKYLIKKGEFIRPLLSALHRDPVIWENPDQFNPDRFSPENEPKIPINAFRPFGTGTRICIGQHFALVEATLALAVILQNFEIIDNPNYTLKIKETVTMKPKDLKVTLKKRPRASFKSTEKVTTVNKKLIKSTLAPTKKAPHHGTPLAIYYGSNMGTSEELAKELVSTGKTLGFVSQAAPLDDAVDNLPNTGAVIFVSSTYNGLPPDNAKKFATWIKSDDFQSKGVKYGVFGCGNTQWSTFQAFPREIDAAFMGSDAEKILERGEADASKDYESDFEAWQNKVWPQLVQAFELDFDPTEYLSNQQTKFGVVIEEECKARPLFEDYGAQPFKVLENKELQVRGGSEGSERDTRHIELKIPEYVSYNIGDHLGVIARNREALVKAVAMRLGYSPDTMVRLTPNLEISSFLPTNQSVSLRKLLAEYIELQSVATHKNVEILSEFCLVEKEKEILKRWSQDLYEKEVEQKRRSIYDLLCVFKSCELPLDYFFDMVHPIKPRYYSISSSSRKNPEKLSITVSIVSAPSLSNNGTFKGVCSSYLQRSEVGDNIWAFVKSPAVPFILPEDTMVPIIMVGPGTGIAPFRGFLEERVELSRQGKPLGEALLFFGCRRAKHDFIYEEELKGFHDKKICELFLALSHEDQSKYRIVQDHIREQSDRIWQLMEQGARIYVCGDGLQMAPDVRKTFKGIYISKKDASEENAETWLQDLESSGRYLTDVFGQKKT